MGNCHCPVVVTPGTEGGCCQPSYERGLGRLYEASECGNELAKDGVGFGSDFILQASAIEKRASPSAPKASRPAEKEEEEEANDEELQTEPKKFLRPRAKAVSSEPYHRGYYKEPYWNKHRKWEKELFQVLQNCLIFRQFKADAVYKFIHAMEIHLRYGNELVCEEGEPGDSLFIILEGSLNFFKKKTIVTSRAAGDIIDEHNILFSSPRSYTMRAKDECVYAKLLRTDYVNLCTRHNFYEREKRQRLLRNAKLLEMMDDESIAKIADVLKVRSYPAGAKIITQGEAGTEFFMMTAGEAVVTKRTADDEQEHMRYKPGDLFGELALQQDMPRAATITAVTRVEVLCLHRKEFERLIGSMKYLQEQQYLTDPRKLIADFYQSGDGQGPSGTLRLREQAPDTRLGVTRWFSVYRPTSHVAIAKMLSGAAVGKGLNVKGKSAKQGILSGYVPFIQIHVNEDKQKIEKSPPGARVQIFYRTKVARKEALFSLQNVLREMDQSQTNVGNRNIEHIEDYIEGDKPDWSVFGLDMPEPLLREAYIMRPDLSPVMGWETGRQSEPAFMDANLHAIREGSDPKVVLYQFDEGDAMNPRGLLVAYAEKYVKPVVSDFDTFLVGSIGMTYETLPQDQAKLVLWALDRTSEILKKRDHIGWTGRWLQMLKRENFHPPLPKYGFGDPTSYRLIADVVKETEPCGAVRHGAECSNFYFPQELDDRYLVIWHGFEERHKKPWDSLSEEALRQFLLERVSEGYSFPLNPVWPVRDPLWYEVLQALRHHPEAKKCLGSWFPQEVGILEKIDQVHMEFPAGFVINDAAA